MRRRRPRSPIAARKGWAPSPAATPRTAHRRSSGMCAFVLGRGTPNTSIPNRYILSAPRSLGYLHPLSLRSPLRPPLLRKPLLVPVSDRPTITPNPRWPRAKRYSGDTHPRSSTPSCTSVSQVDSRLFVWSMSCERRTTLPVMLGMRRIGDYWRPLRRYWTTW